MARNPGEHASCPRPRGMWRGGGRRLTLQRDLCSMSGGEDLTRPVSPAIGEDEDVAGALGRRHAGRVRSPSVASSEGPAREGSRSATPRDGVQRLRARALGRSVSPATTSSAARWRAFMTRRLPDIMSTEGMSSNDSMLRVAAEWREARGRRRAPVTCRAGHPRPLRTRGERGRRPRIRQETAL